MSHPDRIAVYAVKNVIEIPTSDTVDADGSPLDEATRAKLFKGLPTVIEVQLGKCLEMSWAMPPKMPEPEV